jgi:predicted metal-dependent phosphoesterase TrpH
MQYADLHIHTNFSDGTFNPAEVVLLAKKSGIDCVSITDHDTLKAYASFFPAEGIEIIPGIELSADIDNSEAHILGYGIETQERWFQEKLAELCENRLRRMDEMCRKLNVLGVPIKVADVLAFAGNSCVGRLHLARILAKKGFVLSPQAAFNKYIADGGPAYVSKFGLKPHEAIRLILEAKGIPVLAHPYSLAKQNLIPEFIKAGLMGLEVFYPEHRPSQIEHYQKLAKEYGLLITGGSDCHGQAKPEVKIGMTKIPYMLVEKLKDARRKKFA